MAAVLLWSQYADKCVGVLVDHCGICGLGTQNKTCLGRVGEQKGRRAEE